MVKKSPENTTPAIVDNVEALEAKLAQMREAQALFATYTQEQVDKIFYEAAMAANKARIPLAKMAIEETGRGVLEDKVIKNHYAAEYIYNAYKNTKTCGVLERDEAYGITKIAEPIGIVGAVIPTTNPTSTAIFKTLISLKTRNAIILSPHPHAVNCSIAAAKIIRDAAIEAGLPEHVISWVSVPSLEISDYLMKNVDLIMATGGSGMVKAAYSSGTPAIGVGPGNCNVVIDESADLRMAVESIIHSKTFVSDDRTATVGTTNLDFRSLYLHYECGALLYEAKAVMEVKEDFLQTLEICQQVTEKDCKTNIVVHLLQDILRLFAPLM